MFVFIPGSFRPLRFGAAGTVWSDIAIPAVTYIFHVIRCKNMHDIDINILVVIIVHRYILKQISGCFT